MKPPTLHSISQRLVSAEIAKAVSDLHRLALPPETLNTMIERQRSHYATVQIRHDHDGYRLIYNHEKDGTGPFPTLKRARAWFLTGGR